MVEDSMPPTHGPAAKTCKVVFIVENSPVPFDRRVWHEATALSQAGFKVTIIAPRGKNDVTYREKLEGIEIYRYPAPREASGVLGYLFEYSAGLFCQFFWSLWVYARERFQVIHAANPPDTTFVIGFLFKLLRVKFVFDHHDLAPEMYEVKFGRRGVVYRALLMFERLSYFCADAMVVTNESIRKLVIDRAGADPFRLFVVRNGPDPKVWKTIGRNFKCRPGIIHLVVFIGTMNDHDGVVNVLDAAAIIVSQRKRKDIQFVLIGDGPERPNLQLRCRQLELEKFVSFTGRLPDEEAISILGAADVCVSPDPVNRMTDNSTMTKTMDYMALGKAVVQFDTREGRYTAGAASLYATAGDIDDFTNKILRVIDEPDLRNSLGQAGEKRIREMLSWPLQISGLLAVYESLLNR